MKRLKRGGAYCASRLMTTSFHRDAECQAGEGHWKVYSGGLLVATILYEDDKHYEPDKPWCWYMQDIHAGPDMMDTQGFELSIEDAKNEITANFKKWIEWAEL
jgi:hypothetical protein